MRKLMSLIVAALTISAASAAFAEPIVLTEPDKNFGSSVLAAISNRTSAEKLNFTKEKLTLNELSTILWAASGKNDGADGWTIPFVKGRQPNVTIYVILKEGGYVYNHDKHALLVASDEKRTLTRAVNDDFAKTAPCLLVFVSNGNFMGDGYGDFAVGAMAQNVNLAAQALGLRSIFLTSFNKNAIHSSMMLGPVATIRGVMAVGHQ